MNILVTGAQGFIGRHLLEELNKRGHRTFPSSRKDRNGFLKLDVQRPQQMLQMIKELKLDVAVNLAWHTSGGDYLTSPVNGEALEWNREFFKIVRDSSIYKIVSIGSSAEYTAKSNDLSVGTNLEWLYATSKVAAHRSFVETFNSSGIDFVWLRIFQVYGPGQSSQRFVPSLCDHIRRSRLFTLSNPNAVRDWIDVRDVATSIAHIVEKAVEREIDIGTSYGLSNLEICNYAQQRFNLSWELDLPLNETGLQTLVADSNSPLFHYFKPSKNLFDYLDYSLS